MQKPEWLVKGKQEGGSLFGTTFQYKQNYQITQRVCFQRPPGLQYLQKKKYLAHVKAKARNPND
jgi:hypothetical protein